ncbi:unnamed protein product [Echinostoma caproni]|uniref:HTH_48 domain-containing protein n=1 Tax=Echinostoma caproni TaxID=27848 RepID=A0A183B8B3_9TREM|nr:unnamed protein product [Echinostoma caproni]
MPNKNKSEESQPELPSTTFGTLGNLLSYLLSLLSSVLRGGHVHTQPSHSLPAPNKFVLGDDFRRWATDAQEYIELFPEDDRRRILLFLSDGEAKDIARNVIRPGDTITANWFSRLRQ